MNDIERFGILYSALQASESILWTCLLRGRHGYVMGKPSWEAGKWILSFYLVVSTSRRSTTRGIPLFFLTIFLPYIFHQSPWSCNHPYISHISTTRGIPLFFLTIFLPYIFHQSLSSYDHPYISHISTTRGIPLFFLTIFLPYIFHQSRSSYDHPYISHTGWQR